MGAYHVEFAERAACARASFAELTDGVLTEAMRAFGRAHGLRFGGGPPRFRERAAARRASGDVASAFSNLPESLLDIVANAAGPAFTVREVDSDTVALTLHLPINVPASSVDLQI